jgi:CRISPR-associated protein Cas1
VDHDPLTFRLPIHPYLLLGPGSSITTEAVRRLKQEGVCIGFCGSGGTPLLAADDPYPDFLMPADEYRDPRPLQSWIGVWSHPARRLVAAKSLMQRRLEIIEEVWPSLDTRPGFDSPDRSLRQASKGIDAAGSTEVLLGVEGQLAGQLYATCARAIGLKEFTRLPGTRDGKTDFADPNHLSAPPAWTPTSTTAP